MVLSWGHDLLDPPRDTTEPQGEAAALVGLVRVATADGRGVGVQRLVTRDVAFVLAGLTDHGGHPAGHQVHEVARPEDARVTHLRAQPDLPGFGNVEAAVFVVVELQDSSQLINWNLSGVASVGMVPGDLGA